LALDAGPYGYVFLLQTGFFATGHEQMTECAVGRVLALSFLVFSTKTALIERCEIVRRAKAIAAANAGWRSRFIEKPWIVLCSSSRVAELVNRFDTMKAIFTILWFALFLSTNGCMTYSTVKCAKGEENPVMGRPGGDPQPGQYALLPLTVPADIVTSPFQLIYYIILSLSANPP
jgi:hypothetical protein